MLYMAPLLCVNFECLFCWYHCNIGWTQAFPLNRLPLPQSGLKTVFFYLNCWKICHREPCFFMSYYWLMEVIQGSHVDLYGPVFLTLQVLLLFWRQSAIFPVFWTHPWLYCNSALNPPCGEHMLHSYRKKKKNKTEYLLQSVFWCFWGERNGVLNTSGCCLKTRPTQGASSSCFKKF